MAVRKHLQPDGTLRTPQEVWGTELYYWRHTVRGISQPALARRVHCDASYISRLEGGSRTPTPKFTAQLDVELDTGGALGRQLEYLQSALSDYHLRWFRGYAEIEGRAAVMHEWHPFYMSGLLQSEEYARALFANRGHSPERVAELTVARMSRQERLYGPDALVLTVVMDEGVLRRVVGDPSLMARQLRHVLKVSTLPNVTVQILPRDVGMSAPASLMTFLEMPNRSRSFYTESLDRGYVTEDLAELAQHWKDYDRVRAQALSVPQSRLLIRSIIGELMNTKTAQQSVAPASLSWFKASYSADGNGACIEISADLLATNQVPIRDSKDPNGPNLLFPADAFAAFRAAVVAGEFADGERYVI
ncbi:transcriptional regulator with XRE-family HTH domain [Kitasatospora sp. MAA4]|uniref:helix-turn-helix domain-containing protein n=1 Tax=Kitasatospora sp. MAA4 TaxID=3035093 RepID=UPI002476CAE1|nr:Scr1 family TA system antitoxin-like transcriptional regulator [Kitasatospora sp. MAA4]MDH6131958.1 transcriptional regulator with XRE-family HTH domain [Kitasatospora sp. MAA4]